MNTSSSSSNSLEEFLRSSRLEFLSSALKELGVIDISDLRYVTSEFINRIEIMTQMSLIQRSKFENIVEKEKRLEKFEYMKSLVELSTITALEFDEWRREEFLKMIPGVNGNKFIKN